MRPTESNPVTAAAFHTIAWRASDLAIVGATAVALYLVQWLPWTSLPLPVAIAAMVVLSPTMGVVALLLARRRVGGWLRMPPLRRILVESALAVPLLLVAWMCVGLVVLGAAELIGVPPSVDSVARPFVRSEGSTFPVFFAVLAIGVAPVVEELVFRGLLLNALARWMPFVLAAVLQAVLFGLLHPVGPVAIVGLASLGLCFAIVYRWRRTLVTVIAMHVLQNSAAVLTVLGEPAARPHLGVQIDADDDGECRITEIIPGSAAEAVGLQPGDIIVSVNAERVEDRNDLIDIIQRHASGDRVRVMYVRDGQHIDVDATLGEAKPAP